MSIIHACIIYCGGMSVLAYPHVFFRIMCDRLISLAALQVPPQWLRRLE